MVLRTLGAVLLLSLGVSAADAASFDCGKASTPFEQAICNNPDLSAADEQLSVAYQTAIGGLTKSALAEVQASQRNWLEFAQKSCTDDAQLPKVDYSADQVGCLKSTFDSRMRRLEQSRMWNGLRLYPVDSYDVVPDPTAEPDAWNKVAMREISVPHIDGGSAEAAAFNRFMAEIGPKTGGEMDVSSDVQRFATVSDVGSALIGVEISDYWYGHGAAHGNYSIGHANFLRSEGRALLASDVFATDGWEAVLGDLAVAELQRTVEGGIWDESTDDAKAAAADPGRWTLTARGLQIQYQPYEVTAYAYGAPVVTIPWGPLSDYLAAGAIELTY